MEYLKKISQDFGICGFKDYLLKKLNFQRINYSDLKLKI